MAVYANVTAGGSDVDAPSVMGGATSEQSKGLWEVKRVSEPVKAGECPSPESQNSSFINDHLTC